MHIPDGFLSPNVFIPAWVISAGGIGYCLKKTSQVLKDKMVPLMGVTAAFIFAAQMLNFPVMGGTSGHLLGGVLSSVLLGPYAAAVVISIVLIVQCLIFQDGGLTALGANVINMSFFGAIGGYIIFNILRSLIKGFKGILIGAAFASWCSIVAAASACAVELTISGAAPLFVALPAMAIVHMVIGAGEAVITCLVLTFIFRLRPDLIYPHK